MYLSVLYTKHKEKEQDLLKGQYVRKGIEIYNLKCSVCNQVYFIQNTKKKNQDLFKGQYVRKGIEIP